jgi:tRNA modification GTPase
MNSADVILYLIDGSNRLSQEDMAIMETLPQKKSLLVVNKQDLPQQVKQTALQAHWQAPVVSISAATGHGLPQLRHLLGECLGIADHADRGHEHAAIAERHCQALAAASMELSEARRELEQGEAGLLLAACALRRSAENIGMVIGRTYTDDLLDLIFKRFCVGK